uniref:U1-type domain-containing protein n=1 Tax=Parastrongyloides trichosuri TaxID=131310 RepID=A0A0N5A4V1_PARTI
MSFYEKSGSKANIPNHRRTWDLNEYYIKAQERKAKEQEELAIKNGLVKVEKDGTKKELIHMREEKIDLTSKIGKSEKLESATGVDGVGFFCSICDVTVKDSISYMTHINGKSHQKNLGYVMKVKKSSVNDVKARLAKKKSEIEERKRKKAGEEDLFDDVIETDRIPETKYNKKKKKVEKVVEEEEESEDEMMKIMGFGKFAASSNKK